MIGKSYAKIAIVGFVLCLAMVLCASFARYRSEQSFIDGAENGFGVDGMYVNDGATRLYGDSCRRRHGMANL